jgi:uncharacterized cupredoxin-like copper-binding protein
MPKPVTPTVFAALALFAFASSAQAAARSTVDVTLWDKGAMAEMVSDRGIGMTGDKTPATMGVKISKQKVMAGDVTFEVRNASKDTIHEMVVFPYKDGEKIPYSEAESRIDEHAAGDLGEVSELDPGQAGALKLSLKPGKYMLVCNIPGHYMNGMWAILTVEKGPATFKTSQGS